jgi:molybdate transport system permease protein
VAAAFAIRTLRTTFDQLSSRPEEVALTLGASPWQAFRMVALPGSVRGIVAAFCIAWARSIGEFGPILVFAGATRRKTEVLPTTVWLELSVGNLESAVAVSLFMIGLAIVILVAIRLLGQKL